MRICPPFQTLSIFGFVALACTAPLSPAIAQEYRDDARPTWKADGYSPAQYAEMQTRAREDWLRECRRRLAEQGLGGAAGNVPTVPTAKDECETALDNYYTKFAAVYPASVGSAPGSYSTGANYAYGYPPETIMVAAARPQQECVETVVEEPVHRARRTIPARRATPVHRPAPDKRVRDKRIRLR